MKDTTDGLSDEEQKEQVRRYAELHRYLLHDSQPVPPHLFLYVQKNDIPLRFPLACLLARHPSTPDEILQLIAEESPDPECEYPYCSTSEEDRQACRHSIPMEKKIFLYTNLLGRKHVEAHILDTVSLIPESIPKKVRTEILQLVVGRIEAGEETLHRCSLHPDSDYTVLSFVLIHPNTAEEDRVIAALRLPQPAWWEAEQADKRMQEFSSQHGIL